MSPEISEPMPLFFAQGQFSRQDLPQRPIDTLNGVRDHMFELLIFVVVQRERKGAQCVPDVMVHFSNYLHPGYGKPMAFARDLYELCCQEADDQSRRALSQQSLR